MKKRVTVSFICAGRQNGLVHRAGLIDGSTVAVDTLRPQKIVAEIGTISELEVLLPSIKDGLVASGRRVVAVYCRGYQEGAYANRRVKFISDGISTVSVKSIPR